MQSFSYHLLHCCDSLSGSSAVMSQYMASESRMLPNDKLKVLPSLFVIPLPSLFFFLFQFSREAELWPLAPLSRRCRVFSLSLWDTMMALLSTCRHTQMLQWLHRWALAHSEAARHPYRALTCVSCECNVTTRSSTPLSLQLFSMWTTSPCLAHLQSCPSTATM